MADRVLRNSSKALRVTFYVGETPTDSTTAVTVTATRDDGSVIVTDAPADAVAGEAGTYEWVLPAQANLDNIRVDWTGTPAGLQQVRTTWAEIVGAKYVEEAEIRAQPNLANTATFTPAELTDALNWFEETFERFCRRAFVPRYASELLVGRGSRTLIIGWRDPRLLRAVLAGTTAETTTDWRLHAYGAIERTSGTFAAGTQYRARYEHGLDRPPIDVREACLTAVRNKLLTDQSGTRTRELSIRNEYGNVQMSYPAPPQPFGGLMMPGRPFGIPEVDEVAVAYQRRIPAVA